MGAKCCGSRDLELELNMYDAESNAKLDVTSMNMVDFETLVK